MRRQNKSVCKLDNEKSQTVSIIQKKSRRKEKKQQQFLKRMAMQIQPCKQPFSQLILFLKEQYQAEEILLTEQQKETIKINILLNHYPQRIGLPLPLPSNPTEEQIQKYVNQHELAIQQARDYPAEGLGLIFRGLLIGENNLRKKTKKLFKSDRQRNRIVQLELTHEYFCISNDDGTLMDAIILFSGVTDWDILAQTPAFLSYAYALQNRKKKDNRFWKR